MTHYRNGWIRTNITSGWHPLILSTKTLPLSYVPKSTISPKVRLTSALPDRYVFRFLTRLVFWVPTGGGFVLLLTVVRVSTSHFAPISGRRNRTNNFRETANPSGLTWEDTTATERQDSNLHKFYHFTIGANSYVPK